MKDNINNHHIDNAQNQDTQNQDTQNRDAQDRHAQSIQGSALSEFDTNEQIAQRKAKLGQLRQSGNPFPNDFRPNAVAQVLHQKYENKTESELESNPIAVKLGGRIMTRRVMGKASFVNLQDRSGKMQVYIKQDAVSENRYQTFLDWDLGDIIAVEGTLFKTKTGELTVKASKLQLLTKALRPLPDKWHGLQDHELRYRQRYLDLIVNPEVRETFKRRSQLIQVLREFLISEDYLEVETPMMQPIPGGATAKPFITHHNALHMDLYLRVAPELYLKRLVVGGFERVFEINRNFRNEGLSTRHNPEFTMLEFYQSYADYHDFMNFSEKMIRFAVEKVLHTMQVTCQDQIIDFSKTFERYTVIESILKFHPDIRPENLKSKESVAAILIQKKIPFEKNADLGRMTLALFEETVEHLLIQPTFITEYPIEASPLARTNINDPSITDRTELYIMGREIANIFSELNDAEDQAERFRKQVEHKAAGDEEAMHYDADYIQALEYGLPPCAGCGIGIDRLAMIFTNSPSIRDVILFPQLRPE